MAVRAALVVNTGNLVTQGLYFLTDRSKTAVRRKGGAGQLEPLRGKDRPVGCGNGMNQDTLLANKWMSYMRTFTGNLRGWKLDHSFWTRVRKLDNLCGAGENAHRPRVGRVTEGQRSSSSHADSLSELDIESQG